MTAKTVNYTPEQTTKMVADYANGATVETLAQELGKTVRSVVAKLSREKIVFELKDNIALGRTVDCVNFTCQEMRLDPSSKWFDHKSNSCGLVSCKL